jgi:hypothetical protein
LKAKSLISLYLTARADLTADEVGRAVAAVCRVLGG